MKTLEEIQKENREFVIMANNPTAKTYEEALENEIDIDCQFYDSKGDQDLSNRILNIDDDFIYYLSYFGNIEKLEYYLLNCYCILGKPLTLDRVLIALESKEYITKSVGYLCGSLVEHLEKDYEDVFGGLCKWDLKKETLEDQSEETQRKFNELIKL